MFPSGAQVQEVSDQLQNIHKGEDEPPEVVVYMNTHDIGRKRNNVLQSKYRELG